MSNSERYVADLIAWQDAGVDAPGAARRLKKMIAQGNPHAAEYARRRAQSTAPGTAPNRIWSDAHARVPVGVEKHPYSGMRAK